MLPEMERRDLNTNDSYKPMDTCEEMTYLHNLLKQRHGYL